MPKTTQRSRRPDLPSTVARSEEHARATWQKAHDSAVQTYGEDGEAAHRVAFAALKHSYRKEGDRWVRKARRGPSDERAARGVGDGTSPEELERIPTAGGHVQGEDRSKRDLYAEARRLDIPGRSRMSREELAEAIVAARSKR